jgi:hypothetical protein
MIPAAVAGQPLLGGQPFGQSRFDAHAGVELGALREVGTGAGDERLVAPWAR